MIFPHVNAALRMQHLIEEELITGLSSVGNAAFCSRVHPGSISI
jgi:hypothetical protein